MSFFSKINFRTVYKCILVDPSRYKKRRKSVDNYIIKDNIKPEILQTEKNPESTTSISIVYRLYIYCFKFFNILDYILF